MKIIRKYKYLLTIMIIILILIAVIITKTKLNKKRYDNIVAEEIDIIKNDSINVEEKELCTVDIKGAVNSPGVYRLDCDNYVEDIIKAAGNLTENADTSLINLAKKITDEMVIIIYTKEEISNLNKEKECECPEIINDSLFSNQTTNDNTLININ